MAKESADAVTIDLFVQQKKPGRPRTNPLPRNEQLRINKRKQLRRDRREGRRRIELKADQQVYQQLSELAEQLDTRRSHLVEDIIKLALAHPDIAPAVINALKAGKT